VQRICISQHFHSCFSNYPTATYVDFSFSFDGTIDITDVINAGSTLQYGVFATLYVFEEGSGAAYDDFNAIGGEVIRETMVLNVFNPSNDVSEIIDDELVGSLLIDGVDTFDLFASLSVFTSTNLNPVTVTLDFLDTGTFGIDTEPGVTYNSASGVFLDSAGAVPNHPTYLLFAVGLVALITHVRRAYKMHGICS